MDTALELKMDIDAGKLFSDTDIIKKLHTSVIVSQLTDNLPEKPLPLVWRLIGMSEIPFAHKLPYSQILVQKIYDKLSTPFGFSLSGDKKNFLPCYNAMIISALCRLGRANDKQVKNGVDWILNNQPMERGKSVLPDGFNFDRYGGCFKNTPCYIGLAKSVFALHEYKSRTGVNNLDTQLNKGISYLLDHRLYLRLSSNTPVTDHITDIAFPETYHLNAVELLRFAKKAGLLDNDKSKDLKSFIIKRMKNEGEWVANFRYKAEGYLPFGDDWISYIIQRALS